MKTISERIKYIRLNSTGKKLTQQEFGESLGVSRGVISNIEDAENRLPNGVPDSIIRLICSTYHVYYLWLTTGQGPIFEDDLIARIDRLVEKSVPNADPVYKAQVKAYAALMTEEDWEIFRDIVEQVRKASRE